MSVTLFRRASSIACRKGSNRSNVRFPTVHRCKDVRHALACRSSCRLCRKSRNSALLCATSVSLWLTDPEQSAPQRHRGNGGCAEKSHHNAFLSTTIDKLKHIGHSNIVISRSTFAKL